MNFLLVLFSALTMLFSCGNGDKAKENQIVAPDSLMVTDSVAPYAQMQVKENCFIVISKPELKLYVCEVVGDDTVRLVEYPVCMGKNLGQKQKKGDMRPIALGKSLSSSPKSSMPPTGVMTLAMVAARFWPTAIGLCA